MIWELRDELKLQRTRWCSNQNKESKIYQKTCDSSQHLMFIHSKNIFVRMQFAIIYLFIYYFELCSQHLISVCALTLHGSRWQQTTMFPICEYNNTKDNFYHRDSYRTGILQHMDHKPGLEQDYSILIFVVLKVIYLDTDVVK